MPVDKFERNCDTVYTGINIGNLTNSFLRRYGGNTAIDMNIAKNAVTTVDSVASSNLKLNVGSDLVRNLGCNDLTTRKKFTLLLGTDINMLSYSIPDSQLPVPDRGFLILINQQSMPLWPGCNIMQSIHRHGSSFNKECEKSGQ